ncbi:MAG TPA: T9SS type A sorting domain-containing protein [Bacteroidales bacterium]|nr:T9SS type A sorting domain-containing protein [Bacteroidales bacterium]
MRKIFTVIALLATVTFAQAQPGTLDFSFGNEGIVTSVITEGFNMARAIAVQPDGKIIAAGHTGFSPNYDVAVVRYNEDGSNDNTFGTNGMVSISATTTSDYVLDMVLQPDGKIVLSGYIFTGSSTDVLLIRLNADGTPDNTFGTNGIVITDFGNTSEVAEAIVLQDDGKILLAGDHEERFMLVRYNTNGTLDNTFGTGGLASADVGIGLCFGQDVVIQNDGRILVGGLAFDAAANYAFGIARFDANGALDVTFGEFGSTLFSIGTGYDFMIAIALQSDGKIIAGGHTWIGTQPLRYDFAAARLDENGNIDNTFGTNGITTVNLIYGGNYLTDMVIQNDDKIILSGYAEGPEDYDMGLVRLNANGLLDTSFGTDGITITDLNKDIDQGTAVAIQPDGKIVVAGHTAGADFPEFLVARFMNDEVSDPAVIITPLEITNTTVEASFTPNVACASYFALLSTQSEMAMWSAWLGVSVDSLVQMWGIEKTEAFTHLWTGQAPNTEYTLYARPLDANGFGYPLNTKTVTTLTGGGNGLAEMQVQVSQITDSSARLIAIPNDQTALFYDGLITKSYFNEIGQDSAVAVIIEFGSPMYAIDDWVWIDLFANTDYYAIAVGKNALDEWGPATIVEFKTLEPVGIADPVEAQKTISIFPMPNNGTFTFTTPNGQAGSVRIFNTNGQMVFEQRVSGEQSVIDAHHLSNGLYHLQFTSDSKAITVSEKLIIAR